MKLLIAGSRSITEFDLSSYISADVDTVISGGAGGVDSLAEQYADLHRLSKYIVRPRYDLYGRAAPIKRNEQMVNIADAVLLFGTAIPKAQNILLIIPKEPENHLRLFEFDVFPCQISRFVI